MLNVLEPANTIMTLLVLTLTVLPISLVLASGNDSKEHPRTINSENFATGIPDDYLTKVRSATEMNMATIRRDVEDRGIDPSPYEELNKTYQFVSDSLEEDSATLEDDSICPDVDGTEERGAVVKCFCQANEIFDGAQCIPFKDEVVVPVEAIRNNRHFSKLVSIHKYNVKIKDIKCDPEKYFILNFTKEVFHLRARGDVVLHEGAGKLVGQRINKYCIIHHLQQNALTWTLRACIPIPFVPRCCADGFSMTDGVCQAAKTPELFKPPIVSNIHTQDTVDWEIIHYKTNRLICDSDPMVRLPLWNNGSHLVLLSRGLTFSWRPNEVKFERGRNCTNYCVDGTVDSGGRVEYFVNFCYTNPEELHATTCQKGPCIRKCCPDGESYNAEKLRCMEDQNSTTSLMKKIGPYNILIGEPFCSHPIEAKVVKENIDVDSTGLLILSDRDYFPREYCVDKLFNSNTRNLTALVCRDATGWGVLKTDVASICSAISMVFIVITIACHVFIPKMLDHGGIHQLCHITALFITNFMNFTINVFSGQVRKQYTLCVSLGFGMQFGLLATFFWLNVMCFEIWRKIRKLVKFQPTKTYPEIFFMLYGWGAPLIIFVITALMQFVGRHKIRDEIRPYIGVDKCFFQYNVGKWSYLYAPITFLSLINIVLLIHTYFNNRTLLKQSRKASKDLGKIGRATGSTSNKVLREFNTKFKIFALSVVCWACEALASVIPPPELWAPTDCLNSLQGFFVFIILMTNTNKRHLIEKKCPWPFTFARKFKKLLCKPKEEESLLVELPMDLMEK